jgi:WD40 repeat protein
VALLAFSLDGKTLASGSEDGTIRFWDVASGAELNTLTRGIDLVNFVAFSPDGTTLVGGEDRTIRLWDVGRGKDLLNVPVPFPGVVHSVAAFSPDGGRLALACPGGNPDEPCGVLICDFHAYDADIDRWLKEAGVPVPASVQAGALPGGQ